MIDAAKHGPIDMLNVSDAVIRFELNGPFNVELTKDPRFPFRPDSLAIEKVWCSFYPEYSFIGAIHNGSFDVFLDPALLSYVKMLTNLDLVPAESGNQIDGRTEFECRYEDKKAIKIVSQRFLEHRGFVRNS